MPWSFQVFLTLLVLTAAVYDLRYRRIPNWLVLTGLIWGLSMNSFLFGWGGLKVSLIGMGLAFLVYFPLFMARGMGAGDVKLMMAIGSLVGPAAWLGIFLITGVIGGILAIVLSLWRGRLAHTLWNVHFIVRHWLTFRAPFAEKEELDIRSPNAITMPHGATIAAGALLFVIAGSIFSKI